MIQTSSIRQFLVGLGLILFLSATHAADKPDKGKPNKEAPTKEPKAGVFDDLPESDDQEMKKADSKSADPKEGTKEDADGFGSGRASKKKPPKAEPKDAGTEDKERTKFQRAVQKKFTEKKAVYLLRTLEEGYEKAEDPAQAQAAGLNGYVPYRHVEFEICEGQEEGVTFVMDFVSKFGAPWEKKPKPTGRKKKEDANSNTPPKPVRDWEILGAFEDKITAEAARDQAINEYENARQQQPGPDWNR
ncbi:hypothetical protein K2X85_06575 [bacterium]|nr:hypothetical protein [bacterium]